MVTPEPDIWYLSYDRKRKQGRIPGSLKSWAWQIQLVLHKNGYQHCLSNLNDGIGEPCAGHVRAIPDPDDFLKVKDSWLEENFGLVDPIGSTNRTLSV